MSWSEPREDDLNSLAQRDLVQALEQQIAAGFPPGLALDLVLNELVVRAATATRAHAAALALKRGNEMVCRAATGEHAPDLGIVLEGEELVGVLEVFATDPAEFVDSDQNLLEIFARDVTRIRRAAFELEQRPVPAIPPAQVLQPFSTGPNLPLPKTRAPYEIWTLILGTLAILLAVTLSFMIGSRIGWLGLSSRGAHNPSLSPARDSVKTPTPPVARAKQPTGSSGSTARSAPDANAGGLVVYDKGKVVFRTKPAAPKTAAGPSSEASGDTTGGAARVWLAPELAESRLRQRSEPQYPADALAAHRTGDVVLEVLVGADGSVASTRPVSGDPLLVTAAADAVRTWRYEPYRVQGRPAEFQTDVTLKFSLPD